MSKVVTDDKKIEELLTRGVSSIYPNKEFLESKLKKGEKLTLYLGVDPTGPTLHLGHFIPIKKLADFQKLGHRIILLIGDFTATIGDPTDKNATRKPLTRKQVLSNLKNYKKQASKIISFSGKNKALFKFNSKWLSKMNFEDVLTLASKMTVQQMLERDMFEKRMEEGRPISVHEFMYPLMQGYDSVAMNVDGEIGGNDQTFNMLCGRRLLKEINNKEKFVLTTNLLEDNTGKKMGKTEGNMVSLLDNSREMFGKIMSWTDGLIVPGFELCTDISISEVESIKDALNQKDINPKDFKLRLAKEIVKIFFGEKEAEKAKGIWENTFSKKETPDDVKIINANNGDKLIDIFVKEKIISSKSDFRRLINEGAINNMDKDEIISSESVVSVATYKIGKKRFCKIEIK